MLVHDVKPVEIDRAGDMAKFPVVALGAAILFCGAGVPDRELRIVETLDKLLATNLQRRVEIGSLVVAGCRRVGNGLQRMAVGTPSVNAAVEVGVAAVSDQLQRPQQTPGPAAAFIVVGDDVSFRRQPDSENSVLSAASVGTSLGTSP